MNQPTQDVLLSVAAAGTTQATATLLLAGISEVTTVASGSGVILWPGAAGTSQLVYNAGANALKVYPPVGLQFNALGANAADVLPVNTACEYWTVSATRITGLRSA